MPLDRNREGKHDITDPAAVFPLFREQIDPLDDCPQEFLLARLVHLAVQFIECQQELIHVLAGYLLAPDRLDPFPDVFYLQLRLGYLIILIIIPALQIEDLPLVMGSDTSRVSIWVSSRLFVESNCRS